MQIAEPHWLIVGALVSALILALAALDARRRRRAVDRFASPALSEALTGTVARRRRGLKLTLVVLGTMAAFTALARPQWGWRWEQTERRGTDILFAVDTSKSMLAEDLRPNRLERAKLAVSDLVAQFDGDRAGLVAFAGEAFLQSPMTMDRDAFERALRELDTEIIPRGGTDVGAAIREAQAAFGESDHEKVLVLLTDGESLEGDAVQAARDAAEDGVQIFTVGLGGADGAVVPVRGADGEATLLRDPATGELVRSSLDESTLREIAQVTGGDYQPLGQDGTGLTRLWRDHLAELPAHAVASRRHRVFTERFQWPLGLAIVLLLIEPLITERRRRRGVSSARGVSTARGVRAPAMAAASAMALWMLPAIALASPRDAQEAYRKGEFARAQQEFAAAAEAAPQRAELHINEGVAAYRAGDHEAASVAMDRAVRAGDVEMQQRAYYDRGNAQFRLGEATLDSDREATKSAWRAALASYESALELDADDEDARFNAELVRRRIAMLEQAQQGESEQPQQRTAGRRPAAAARTAGRRPAAGRTAGRRPAAGGQQGEGQQPQQGQRGEGQPQQGQQGEGQPQDGQQGEGQQPRDGQQGEGQPQDGRQPEGAQPGDESEGAQPQDGQQSDGTQPRGDQQGAQPRDAQQGAQPEPHEGAAADPQQEREGAQPDDGAASTQDQSEPLGMAGSDAAGDAPAGRLTPEEATQLLRSIRGDDRRFPLTRRSSDDSAPTSITKDW